ncbi:MAG: hypothetical protein ACXAAP_13235 [Candidatus Thorarchaeota archaeon]
MKLASLFSPFIRLINSVKRTVSPPSRRYFEPKPSDHVYEPGTWNNDLAIQTKTLGVGREFPTRHLQ